MAPTFVARNVGAESAKPSSPQLLEGTMNKGERKVDDLVEMQNRLENVERILADFIRVLGSRADNYGTVSAFLEASPHAQHLLRTSFGGDDD